MKKLIGSVAIGLLCIASSARADGKRTSRPAPSRSSDMMSSTKPQLLVGADADFGIPVGNNSNVNGLGGGLLLTGEYPLMDVLSATARVGFQYHADKTLATGVQSHVHSIPFLLGAKYYPMQDRQGLFAAAEAGLFELIAGSSVNGLSASASSAKFGMGVGLGYQVDQWNARVNLHTQDVGNFGSAYMVTAGIGYQFAGF